MVIDLKNISKKYGENIPVLNDLSLQIPEGIAVAITGPSGSGKSTLLNLMGTLDFPDSGEVKINGMATSALSETELTRLRNEKIGFVFQSHLLLPQLTVLENILLPVIPREKSYKDHAPDRALKLLEIVGLSDKLNRLPGEMSVGECQRVAVIRALINEPELLLADEPTGSLDHNTAENLSDMLITLRKHQSFTLVVVTHSKDLAGRMEKIYKLTNARLEAG